ncbi:unnamed protein product [Caenorhabditis bovis]|uniref:Cytochrome P450 n=1 Tax=Caenorhabditis bovis TaxID=2654633 RepID=A0A8S1F0M5_9PELO|nr:unnamed protein product [Caenorhabditis bovis]
MIIILAILFVFILVFLGYFKWKHTYWKRRGINGPPTSWFLGNYYEVSDMYNMRYQVLNDWSKKYGKTFGYYEGVRNVLVTSDLSMLNELFIKKFSDFHARKVTNVIHADLENPKEEPLVNIFLSRGSRWKRMRALGSPAFSVKALKQVHGIIEDSILNMIDLMSKYADERSFNIHKFYQELTFDVISRVAMGQTHSELFNNPRTMLTKKRENEKNGIENVPEDFIDIFLDHHVDELNDAAFGTSFEKKATTEEVISNCFVFLLAGFDTTANTLAYASHAIVKHPDVGKKIQQEVDSVCSDGNISYDDLNKMSYLEAVVKETLRLYPIAYFACSREAVNDTSLGNIKIDKGTFVEADVLAIHTNPEIWGNNADQFYPERFLEKTETPRHVMSWIPFGAGPRQCLGMRLGIIEAKLVLAHVLRKFDIVKAPDTEEELKLHGCSTISPEKVTVQLKSR